MTAKTATVTAASAMPLTQTARGRPWPVWAMAGLALLTLALVGWQRLGAAPATDESAAVTWQRALHFEDRPNGDVAVLDAQDRAEVARFSGEQGFLRGVLRTLARDRMRSGFGPAQPFVLSGHADGRMSLADPATGTRVALESFGPTNAAVFAPLRDAGRAGARP